MSHYYSQKQDSAFAPVKIQALIGKKEYHFFSASGVFSKSKIDYGTKLLAEHMQIGKDDTVLDLGCGIGILGRAAAEKTKNQVIMVDVNERAVHLARMNTKALENVEVLESDTYSALKNMKFHVILLNPPQTAGKKVCFQMIADAKHHLENGGNIQVVARHNKGGETLSKHMREVFGNMETLVKQGGYRVYKSIFNG
ncbi:class I SAM-dependent methyltransferase [Candidatus Woesearchaeota archaeon]|nr:class I SAM-dependent methyltransferase [Candidatus Woesearchaeota archaeon]